MAEENKLDIQDVMMRYDKRSGVIEIIKRSTPPIVIGKIMINDL